MRTALLFVIASLCCAAVPKAPVAKRSDAQIEEAIRASYAKSKIGADHFTVKVKNGVATIEGKTEIIQRKGWATRYAKLGGASQVNNNIQISEVAKEKARAKLAAARERRSTPLAPKRAAVAKPTPAAVTVAAAPPPTTAPSPGPRRAIIRH